MKTEFYLLRPENLPASREELNCPENMIELLDNIIDASNQGDEEQLLKLVYKSIETLMPYVNDVKVVENDPEESAENKANDQSFNIRRVHGNSIYMFTYSLLQSYKGMMEEAQQVGIDLSPVDWGKLRFAYTAIFTMLRGNLVKANLTTHSTMPIQPKERVEETDGMRRWVQGHYVFMSIIQGMVVALKCFIKDFEDNQLPAARAAMNMAAILMAGSEGALKFTGNFSRDHYEKFVRPSLSPPIAPPGMSGVNWRDHEYMIRKVFNKLRPIFSNPPKSVKNETDGFLKALGCTYSAHKYVCTFFVGKERSSLLSKKSASQMLENYKHNRLRLLQKELQT